jgi:hypothetical protein
MKAGLRFVNHILQDIPLLSGALDWRPHAINTRRDIEQQGDNQENHKMGH